MEEEMAKETRERDEKLTRLAKVKAAKLKNLAEQHAAKKIKEGGKK
jgi:hypothetical protein